MAGGQSRHARRVTTRAKECSTTKHSCEKWQRLCRRRQLGGCDREAAVHRPLMADGRRPEPPCKTGGDASQGLLDHEAPLREVAAVALSAAARRLRSESGGLRAAADGWRPEPPAGWAAIHASQGVLGCEAQLREVAAVVSAAAARRLRSGSGGPRAAADSWRPEPPCQTGGDASQGVLDYSCEKGQRLCRRRQLGGCDREAAVHGPLLMAGSQSRHARRAAKRARGARLRSTAARSGGSCGGGGSSEAAIEKRRFTGRG